VKAAANNSDESAYNDEITMVRRVAPASPAPTARMPKIDERLLAIARGDLDCDDPFGGLIPIYENDVTNGLDDGWLVLDSEPEPSSSEGMFGSVVPCLRMQPYELLGLALSERSRFFVSQIDGKRTVGKLIDVCRLDDLDGLEIIDELLRMGAIALL